MKKLWTLSFALVFMLVLATTALADVAVGPMYAVIFGVPVLVIAVVVIALALLVRVIKRKRGE